MTLTNEEKGIVEKAVYKGKVALLKTSVHNSKKSKHKNIDTATAEVNREINSAKIQISQLSKKIKLEEKEFNKKKKEKIKELESKLQSHIIKREKQKLLEDAAHEIEIIKLTIKDEELINADVNRINLETKSKIENLNFDANDQLINDEIQKLKEQVYVPESSSVKNIDEEIIDLKNKIKSLQTTKKQITEKTKNEINESVKKLNDEIAEVKQIGKDNFKLLKQNNIYLNAFNEPVKDYVEKENIKSASYNVLSDYLKFKARHLFIDMCAKNDVTLLESDGTVNNIEFSNENLISIEQAIKSKEVETLTNVLQTMDTGSKHQKEIFLSSIASESTLRSVIAKIQINSSKENMLIVRHIKKYVVALVMQTRYDILFNFSPSFNNELKKISYSVKQEHEYKIIDVIKTEMKKILFYKANTFGEILSTTDDYMAKFESESARLKEVRDNEIDRVKKAYLAREFSKQSKDNSIKNAKYNYKSSMYELKIANPKKVATSTVSYMNLTLKREIRKEYKILYSKIDEAQRRIPTKALKGQGTIAAIASFVLPGVGQIINRQYVKGILLLLLSGFIYGLLIPFAFGIIRFQGEGVFGLGVLSPSYTYEGSSDIFYHDARFRIVEGILSLFALLISVVAIIASSRDAYHNGKALEAGARPANYRDLKRFLSSQGVPYLLSAPAFLLILLTVVTPLITTFMLAFTNYSQGHIPPGNPLEWVGWDNFKAIFSGLYAKSFKYVSMWTLVWTVSVTIGILVVGTCLALIIDNPRIKGKALFSTVFILPWAVPAFSTILFFSIAFSSGGLVQEWFNTDIDFHQSANWTKSILIMIQIWLGHSYIFLLMLGVKKSISSDFYEAASIDGATKVRQFLKITAPIILAQIMPLLIGQIVFNFNNYGIIWMYNGGGPFIEALPGGPGSTDIIISFIFRLSTGGTQNRVALASAFTMFVSLFIVTISAIGFVKSKSFKGVN